MCFSDPVHKEQISEPSILMSNLALPILRITNKLSFTIIVSSSKLHYSVFPCQQSMEVITLLLKGYIVFAFQVMVQVAVGPWGTKTGSWYTRSCRMCVAKGWGDKNSLESTPASHARLSTQLRAESSKKKGSRILCHTVLGKGAFATLFDGVCKCEWTLCRYLVMFCVPMKRI